MVKEELKMTNIFISARKVATNIFQLNLAGRKERNKMVIDLMQDYVRNYKKYNTEEKYQYALKELELIKRVSKTYENFDVEDINVIKIRGNQFFYDSKRVTIDNDIFSKLADLPRSEYPLFVDIYEGELVFS